MPHPTVVTHLNARADEEVHQNWLELCLTRFEIISGYKDSLLDSKLNNSWHKSVLGGAIDVGTAFQDTCHSKECRRRNLPASLGESIKRSIGQETERQTSSSALQPTETHILNELLNITDVENVYKLEKTQNRAMGIEGRTEIQSGLQKKLVHTLY